jgi:Tfp pilus assembly protein PilX
MHEYHERRISGRRMRARRAALTLAWLVLLALLGVAAAALVVVAYRIGVGAG